MMSFQEAKTAVTDLLPNERLVVLRYEENLYFSVPNFPPRVIPACSIYVPKFWTRCCPTWEEAINELRHHRGLVPVDLSGAPTHNVTRPEEAIGDGKG